MSWWNTSNFSDLASKALKNAQKKIDKALDISEGDGSSATTTDDGAAAAPKPKSDLWNSWMGDSSSTDSSQTATSAWSLPWGVDSESEADKTDNVPVREKTAEEIKAEVLQAAKMRAKAKSKLFSKNEKSEKIDEEKVAVSVDKDKKSEDTHQEDKEQETKTSGKDQSEEIKSRLNVEKAPGDVIPTVSDLTDDTQSDTNVVTRVEPDPEKEGTFDELAESVGDRLVAEPVAEAAVSQILTEHTFEMTELHVDVQSDAVYPVSDQHKLASSSSNDLLQLTEDVVTCSTYSDKGIDDDSDGGIGAFVGGNVQIAAPELESMATEKKDSDDTLTESENIAEPGSNEPLEKLHENTKSFECISASSLMEVDTAETVMAESCEEVEPLSDSLNKCDGDTAVSEKTKKDSLAILQAVSAAFESEKVSAGSDSESSLCKLDLSMDTCTSEETVVDAVSTVSSQDENDPKSSHHVEDNQSTVVDTNPDDNNSNDQAMDSSDTTDEMFLKKEDGSDLSPANSYVKCMLEDAMDDSKHDDSCDCHSATEKSDGSRSTHSNHESSDEIDTTTSSDIEIISMPTPNGENRQISPVDPIPLRMALQKTNWPNPTHRRTDSSDSSNTSKDGGYSELSPGRDHLEYPEYASKLHHDPYEGHRPAPELPALSEEEDTAYHPQKLLKKLADMAEVVQAREDKLLQQSKENCDLMETNSILRNQLKQAEETHESEMADVNELTAEFTQRLTEAEKRVSAAIKDKENVKKQLHDSQTELAKRSGDINLKQVLIEKEEQIAGLLEEGEKLSRSQLQSNTIIKKLRQKEKDSESTITSQKKKLDAQKEELDHLRKALDVKEELEKKQTEAIAQLTSAVNKQEQEMVRLKSEHEDSTEKVRGLQAALDNSYKEMAELHRTNAVQDSKAQEAALSAETQVREELKLTIEKQQQQHKWDKDTLGMQMEDLQLSMMRMEKDHNRREDLLRQEIADLQKQLQEDEARTQELTQGVSLATRPLLRQIENLQSTFNAQSSTWEAVERSLSDRLSETQNQLAVSMEKERTANDQVLELGSKVTSFETQTVRLRQEKSQLTAQLEMLKTKVEMTEDAKQSEAAQIEVMKQQLNQEIKDLKKQKVLLETQLDLEKSKFEQEKKKVSMMQEQLRDAERDLQRSVSRSTPVRATPSPVSSVSRQDSMVSSFQEHSFSAITQDELDRSFSLPTYNGNKQSLYEALRQSGAANLLENLQSQLKQREGEISHLQSEIHNLERTREAMAKELVDLSNKNTDLEEKLEEMPHIQAQHKEVNQRYSALLQMYGEKVEEADELRLDLQDVKDMYKAQINQLLGQS